MWSPQIIKKLNKNFNKDKNQNPNNMETNTSNPSFDGISTSHPPIVENLDEIKPSKIYKSKSAEPIMYSGEGDKHSQANTSTLEQIDVFIDDDADESEVIHPKRVLSKYEKDEYDDLVTRNGIDKIFYMGDSKQLNLLNGITNNSRYQIYTDDHILYRYQIIEKLGKGAYSDVVKCFDHKHGKIVALKITKNEKKYQKSFENEITIMSQLLFERKNYKTLSTTRSELIAFIQKRFYWRSHPVIVMNIYNKNLYNSKLGSVPWRIGKIIINDILEGLSFLKSQNIIHCDLKPENIFFIDDCTYNVVIGDFGMSINKITNKEKINYYIQTRWYRAPDVVLNIPYDFAIDMWSAGGIFVELLTNTVVFRTNTEYELLYISEKIIGSTLDIYQLPTYKKSCKKKNVESTINKYYEVKNSFMKYGKINQNIIDVQRKIELIENNTIKEIIKRIFVWDPDKRITSEHALAMLKEY